MSIAFSCASCRRLSTARGRMQCRSHAHHPTRQLRAPASRRARIACVSISCHPQAGVLEVRASAFHVACHARVRRSPHGRLPRAAKKRGACATLHAARPHAYAILALLSWCGLTRIRVCRFSRDRPATAQAFPGDRDHFRRAYGGRGGRARGRRHQLVRQSRAQAFAGGDGVGGLGRRGRRARRGHLRGAGSEIWDRSSPDEGPR